MQKLSVQKRNKELLQLLEVSFEYSRNKSALLEAEPFC